ncbi:exopolysaccharide transport family protein [Thioalbus denitrificans]|uniref:non-specific protein-tyrosine kinase n=2 Tax=Thioalbus denitrificans TaxID=547122 RepID=A0A369CHX5_9GAMM|nr:exopolysaccharide transport family protein [Thioalbus denitrificans]
MEGRMNNPREMGLAPRVDDDHYEEDTIDLLAYWRTIYAHKWGILGLAFVVGLVTALVAFSLEPVYQAKTSLLIEPKAAKFLSIEDLYGPEGVGRAGEYYQTQKEIIQSRTLAEDVVNRLQLWTHPEFDPTREAPSRARLNLKLADWLPWLAKDEEPPTEEAVRKATVDAFMSRLGVEPVRNSQIIDVTFEANDPKLSAEVANTVANAYIEAGLEARLSMVQKATSWLTDRLDGLRTKVEESEKALQAYREQQGLVDMAGDSDLASAQLQSISERLVSARAKVGELESMYAQARNLQSQGATSLSSLQSPLVVQMKTAEAEAERKIAELSQRYGPKHPKMIAAQSDLQAARQKLRGELGNVVAGVNKELAAARATAAQLQREYDQLKGQVQDVNRKGFRLQALEREVAANRQLYDTFLTRFKETNVAGDMDSTNARVVDPAVVPTVPVKPRKALMVSIAIVLALFAGIGLAFLLEHLDNTLKSGEELEDRLGLPMLGSLPLLRLKKGEQLKPERVFADDSKSTFAEAIRTIRTGVVLSGLDNPHKIVVVTSTIPGEGKTTVSMNLALALGQLEKVLLIDADMRRASIAQQLGFAKDTPGLSNLVAGTAKASECIHPVEGTSVHVLPAGIIPPNPLELLSSHRFRELLDKLSEAYDRIVIDTAPTQAVSDALVLSTQASAVVYVVKADSTPYPLAQTGVKRLRHVNAPLVGAVLNQVDIKKAGRYGKYGRYGYDRYYHYDYYGSKA